MIRVELKQALAADYPDLSPRDIELVLRVFFGEIITRLAQDGRVEIRGFGSFNTRARGARVGRDPRTGDAVQVGDRRIPWFKPGKELRALINAADGPDLT